MWFYYGGVEEDILIEDYNIDIQDSSLLNKTFPLATDYYNRLCIHCKIPLVEYKGAKPDYLPVVFCKQCTYLLEDMYNCQCDKCLEERGKVIQAIRDVFEGVVLANGVGLYEGQGLDDYASEEERRELRSNDELMDWANIPVSRLNECYSSLSFFDAAGMRFHLPAFLLAELNNPYGNYNFDCIFHLTKAVDRDSESTLREYVKVQFSLFSKPQRNAVRLFLLHILNTQEYEFNQSDIRHALDTYWVE